MGFQSATESQHDRNFGEQWLFRKPPQSPKLFATTTNNRLETGTVMAEINDPTFCIQTLFIPWRCKLDVPPSLHNYRLGLEASRAIQ
ncbi:uncharacterized protein Bfra_011860 [Botrytis fragariae]|uniref:Uncharacterized protein n=1 Tax=Botrytis fragariae TaxID=1964551 RepID=A0A8H6AKD4_9HELO|nr:uncharacterized protein Bfra_011860 [Botrytis fragariae]KAF5868895.1 hypothetical protein Bfra_011860 [Botrytis fragariae]